MNAALGTSWKSIVVHSLNVDDALVIGRTTTDHDIQWCKRSKVVTVKMKGEMNLHRKNVSPKVCCEKLLHVF